MEKEFVLVICVFFLWYSLIKCNIYDIFFLFEDCMGSGKIWKVVVYDDDFYFGYYDLVVVLIVKEWEKYWDIYVCLVVYVCIINGWICVWLIGRS